MFFFAPKKKESRKIQGDFTEKVKSSLKAKLCPFCDKVLSTKMAFGEGVNASLTCNNCELRAVGGVIQKLGEQNLIGLDKFAGVLTTEASSYQLRQTEPAAESRQVNQAAQITAKKVKESTEQIKDELRKLRQNCKTIVSQLGVQAQRSSSVVVFEQVLKSKGVLNSEQMTGLARRSLVNSKGLSFVDYEQLEGVNSQINERYLRVKKECRAKLKDLRLLTEEINNVKL